MGSIDGRFVQGVRRWRTDADPHSPADLMARRRRNECRNRCRTTDASAALRSSAGAGCAIAPGPLACRMGADRRSAGAAQRPGDRRGAAAGRLAEGRHHQHERGLASQERRGLQRQRHAARVLGSRRVSQRRRLAHRHLGRQRSALSRERLHDQHALQARSGWIEVETGTMSRVTRRTLCSIALALLAAASLNAPSSAQGQGQPAPPTMVDLAGSWTMSNEEELLIRIDPGPELGNFTGFPINAAGRQKALTWNSTIQAVPEHQARPHPAQYSMRGPGPSFHMGEIIDPVSRRLTGYTITGLFENANRTIWLDGRPHPSEFAEHLWQGFSTGVWENGMLKVTTTHMKQAFLQRNGIPSSPYAVMTEYFIRHGQLLMMISQVDDPIYLEEPMIRTSTWRWNPGQREGAIGQVEIAEELPDIKLGDVPHYPLGTRHPEYADANGLPFEATLGGKDTLYPEYVDRLKEMMGASEKKGSR